MGTTELVESLGEYLAAQNLAQWSETADYRDDPSLPAVLFGDADVPDHCVVLTVTGRNRSLDEWEVSMTYRAVGIDGLAVSTLADRVSDHLREAFDFQTQGEWVGGSIRTLPSITLPGGITVVACNQTGWGTVELTSAAKHKGSRFTRADTYLMSIR